MYRLITFCIIFVNELSEKERDLTQSNDENPYTNRKFNNQLTTKRRHQKLRLNRIVARPT